MKNIVIVASLFLLLLQQVNSSEVIVRLNSGKIRGVITRSLPYGLHARQFLGIPYAEAPLGELRFSPPIPIKPWSGVRDANEFPALCPQPPMPWPFPPAGEKHRVKFIPVSRDQVLISDLNNGREIHSQHMLNL